MIETVANAKINLFLEITGRRNDGYHTVDTIMQEISLADVISIRLLPKTEGILIKTNVDSLPTDERNIAFQAARRYFNKIDADCGAEIIISKQIPHEAGLGGGSSDGAAVLKVLNELCGRQLETHDLHQIAASMGADVPFFLYGGTTAMNGIGTELVAKLKTPELYLVVVKPPFGISTPAAFKLLDKKYDGFFNHKAMTSDSIVQAVEDCSIYDISKCLFNRFEIASDDLCPPTKVLRDYLNSKSHGALLSGSGSSVFAVADSKSHAAKLKAAIKEEFPNYFVNDVKTISAN